MIRAKTKPIGDTRADLRLGMLSAMFANAHSKKGTNKAKPEHFVIGWPDRDKITDPKQMEQMFAMFAAKIQRQARGNTSRIKRKPKGQD